MKTAAILFAVLLSVALSAGPGRAAEERHAFLIDPLSSEGYLWAPAPSAAPGRSLVLKLGFLDHDFEDDPRFEADLFTIALTLSGEWTFLERFTAGLDLPLLMTYEFDVDVGPYQVYNDSGADFGNLRVQVRYAFLGDPASGLWLTPALRVWLPTNTFLSTDDPDIEWLSAFAALEPMILLGWGRKPISFGFQTGPKLFLVDDRDDFSFWSVDFCFGASPFSGLEALQLVAELNLLFELDENAAPGSLRSDESLLPVALSFGARYLLGPLRVETAFRLGLHEGDLYYGDFNFGLNLTYLFGG